MFYTNSLQKPSDLEHSFHLITNFKKLKALWSTLMTMIKIVPPFFLFAKSRGSCRTFVIVEETKRCTNQLLLLRLLYDEKRDKKETEYGSEILRVNDLLYLFFKFSYLGVNNCYHVIGSLQTDSMPKLQIYNTSSDTTCSFSEEQRKITPLLLESYWVS